MDESIKIRKATVKDIKEFMVFFRGSLKNLFPEYSQKAKEFFLKKEWTEKSIRNLVKNSQVDVLIAVMNKRIVGDILINKPFGGVSFVSWIAVDPEFQKIGIGSLLLKKCETVAKNNGSHKVTFWTARRNIGFYKKRGYVLVGHIPENYFGADDWLFYKSIRKSKY